MTDKSEGKLLLQLEQHFADKNPVMMQVVKAYHELDQVAYDLGLLEQEDSIASGTSWWPLITIIGSPSSRKSDFINKHLKMDVFQEEESTSARFSVLYHSETEHVVTLPGTALDRDPRFPFYHISDKIDLINPGEGRNINNFLELKTCNSSALKGKIMVTAPGFDAGSDESVNLSLIRHVVEISDLVLVFFDASESNLDKFENSLTQFFEAAASSQNPGKFVYIVNQTVASSDPVNLSAWKERLAVYGYQAGQFFALQGDSGSAKVGLSAGYGVSAQSQSTGRAAVEQRMLHVNIDSAYRIVNSLERNILDMDEVVINEVRQAIKLWKDRVHFTISLLLSGLAFLLVLGEIKIGAVAMLIDPIIGPAALAVLIVVMVPIHLYVSKQHAKLIIKGLKRRQQELGLVENLSGLFEKNLTFWRMLLPIKEPVGWDKVTQHSLQKILDQSKELVQMLNDNFGGTGDKSFL